MSLPRLMYLVLLLGWVRFMSDTPTDPAIFQASVPYQSLS